MSGKIKTIDGNEAVAAVAHKLNEVIAIYPITPSSPMGEFADAWSAQGEKNIWDTVPEVIEMQAEGGAAGAVHGALQTGSLTTTFTASQGLLLMIPNMYKIAGELTSTVFHVSARSIAAQALSIFGDHSDVMAARSTGFAMLGSASVQEAHDFSLIAQAATLKSRVPFIHFFDGFRVSHELNKIEMLDNDVLNALIDDDLVREHRARGLSPDRPVIRGTAQNPDVFFQARETVNPFYEQCPDIVQDYFNQFAKLTGRAYKLYEYHGASDAEHVIVIMGSGSETVIETVKHLNAQGEKIGVVVVRLYRPFSIKHFIESLPATVKVIATLDRTKEPGASGEPLYQDVITSISEAIAEGTAPFKIMPRIVGGRYGLSSKEFTPAMVKGIFDEIRTVKPKNHFTVGIYDDVTNNSISYDPSFSIESDSTVRALFFGLGSDGTVGANKNSIKIIGEETDNFAQGYFVYDSKKAGAKTISHLRFGPEPIRAPYLISEASFIACHQFNFLDQIDVLKYAVPGAVFLLNSTYGLDEVWNKLSIEVQQTIIEKKLEFYIIDAYQVAKNAGMGGRINTVMQTCFFAISGVLPRDEAIEQIKGAIKKTYGKKGEIVVRQNYAAVDQALAHLNKVDVPAEISSTYHRPPAVSEQAPDFVRNVLGTIIAGDGDNLPVSAFPIDGTYPSGTTQWEKRNISLDIPVWEEDLCIQCGKCAFICPHAVIRQKIYDPAHLENAPETFKSKDGKFREFPDWAYTIQVAPEDCTGCTLCVEICPAKDRQNPERKALNMALQAPIVDEEKKNWDFFLTLPEADRTKMKLGTIKNSQLLQPLFEFSGACAGCGETPYIKLATQLFGDRMVIANATGCSSIYGGNLPTTPYTVNEDGRGPSWSNSLFEDNAEFGLGMRLTIDKQNEYAKELLTKLAANIGEDLAEELLNADQSDEAGIQAQRERVETLKTRLENVDDPKAKDLLSLADVLVEKSVWIIGGDGWAYDIGYGGLDHVLASGRNVNILVLDTQVYSNTGGQSSKATPIGAVAKFAADGKSLPRKDIGMIAMSYGYIYVAQVSMGAKDTQTLKAFQEAAAFDGPSLILAYSPCIAHGLDIASGKGLEQQKLIVDSGLWPLYRYNPDLALQGKNPLQLDSKKPKIPVSDFAYNEGRYSMLLKTDEERAEKLMKAAQADVDSRWMLYEQMAATKVDNKQE
ncbi:MAG: pyruvate:ferredoxin (flavodoxin) oxidoreductase [Chloroflexi bacterium]|nr:pyruvate:ferredoxin (flavodoxin) oxidoreductase [Chloroflexota bacterium]